MAKFDIGDQVLWIEQLTTTLQITGHKDLPSGRIYVAEGAAPFKLEAPAHQLVARPKGWRDAPERPACRCGRFDGAGQDDVARHAWFVAMMRWEREHKQPLLARLPGAPSVAMANAA